MTTPFRVPKNREQQLAALLDSGLAVNRQIVSAMQQFLDNSGSVTAAQQLNRLTMSVQSLAKQNIWLIRIINKMFDGTD